MSQNLNLQKIVDNAWLPQSSTNTFKLPRISRYLPTQGQESENFQIVFDNQEFEVDVQWFRIAFDNCFTECQSFYNSVTQTYSINTTVPNPGLINHSDLSRVPVYLAIVEQDMILDSWCVGYFSYFNRKRPSTDYNSEDPKRSRPADLQAQPNNFNIDYGSSSATSNFYNLQPNVSYVGLTSTQPSQRPREYFENHNLLGFSSHGNFQNSNPSQFQTFNEPNFMSTNANSSNLLTNPNLPAQLHPHIHPHQIQPHQIPVPMHPPPEPFIMPLLENLPTFGSPEENPDPFAGVPRQAELYLEGDLHAMTEGWTEAEQNNGRRLVQFVRRQEGNSIYATFEPFEPPANERVDYKKMIVVSCIYWPDMKDYFITSVDCIHLIECLLGIKFTMEEKNRVRRNLEGYRPTTISKMRDDSSAFFKKIMSFSSPKPRNIEKDLKVFQWDQVYTAIKKIINKYQPSFSSTVSVVPGANDGSDTDSGNQTSKD